MGCSALMPGLATSEKPYGSRTYTEGTGYRAKTRFGKIVMMLPELMAMFKEIADIKTAEIC